ncbi:MAG: valine--tRNA ligase [Chloroflexota bacterium]
MGFPRRYKPAEAEPRWQEYWSSARLYEFDPDDPRPIFAIDTPPPTVSGELHIGHVYSYVQAEAMARFWRMQGYNVYYPFGFDDNGLPTERYVEQKHGIRARDIGRAAFIDLCLATSQEVETRFEQFWKSLGFSVDWRMRYSTIDPNARRTSQWSFLDLYRKGLIYQAQEPNPWCAECQTAVAQAEMDDIERTTTFYTLAFQLTGDPNSILPIATTRPELLAACVAIFVHPDDSRFADMIGQEAITPLFERRIPILADTAVDPEKGSGAVMCCTFGDATDVIWWRTHQLPLIPLVTREGRLSEDGGRYAGLRLQEAREQIIADIRKAGKLLGERATEQSVRVHERCRTPLEILETNQWFIRILDAKEALLEAGRQITWYPAHMQTRYEHWVENLGWDWSISRQRFYGVAFPLWHCDDCGDIILAEEDQLPIDPTTDAPPHTCTCGNRDLRPETDVMDTWATSSVSPQIVGQLCDKPALYKQLFPMQLRPQAHDIIRTWAFYTIVKSHYHSGTIPWETVMISGHGLNPYGHKLSKSSGNSDLTPTALIGRYDADAVRYWACGGSVGMDQPINEDEMKQGTRLITKLWNASRFIAGHMDDFAPPLDRQPPTLWPADRALLSWLQRLIEQATERFRTYEYAAARDMTERFFWGTLCDNYLELVKSRLYDTTGAERYAAQWTLYQTLQAILKLFAPILPHITEEIFSHLFAAHEGQQSIHLSPWPHTIEVLIDTEAEQTGEALLALTTHVRRVKSSQQQSLGSPLTHLAITTPNEQLAILLEQSTLDLQSITRAQQLDFVSQNGAGFEEITPELWAKATL